MKNITLKKANAQKVTRRTTPAVTANPPEIKYMTAKKCAAVYAAASDKMEASRRYLAEN